MSEKSFSVWTAATILQVPCRSWNAPSPPLMAKLHHKTSGFKLIQRPTGE